MKLLLPILLALMVVVSSAHKFTVTQVKRQELGKRDSSDSTSNQNATTNAQNGLDLNSIHDLIYLTNITVGGLNYSVQLDTGSSDLFIKGDTYPIPNTNETSIMHNLTYAIGWAYGHIAYAPVTFFDISVPSQAFLDAVSVDNPALSYGAQGIAGLGFTRLSSIDGLLNSTRQSTGRSLLHNLFLVNLSQPNFISFALQRSTDADSNVQGSFAIVEPQFANISNNAPIPTWPIHSPFRWNILIDAVIVNNNITVPTSSVDGAPSNKAVALIDSGASYSYVYVAKEVCDAIYGKIPGAVFNATTGFWMLPCGAEVDMAFQIGGQLFPLHPLDVNPTMALDPSTCIGSFVPQSVPIGSDVDWLIGDNFLRSVYSIYDFGDFDASGQMGDPYMKFLSLIDPNQASADFHKIRGGTPNINITYTGLSAAAISPSFNLSVDTSQALETIAKFVPAILALVALNALVLIICCIVWLVSTCRRRNARAIPRIPRSRSLRTTPLNHTNFYAAETLSPSTPHVYEPVSMALTEDTFVPPSPAFYNSGLQPGDRPKSYSG
ncbi:aspartic peptidase A1 [Phlegmacium glaucopus]|nr:aspartic peptidase A1 [Phlegmacium glaucopus]